MTVGWPFVTEDPLQKREWGFKLFFTSPLVALQRKFKPCVRSHSKTFQEKREREKDRLVLLMLGRDDHLLLVYID